MYQFYIRNRHFDFSFKVRIELSLIFVPQRDINFIKTKMFHSVNIAFIGGKMTSMMMKGVFLLLFATVLETRGKLVNVTLYSESLCPDCAAFVTGPLDRAVREVS